MKRIGDIAARLVANPIELVAAANQKRSTEFADGSPNEGVTSEPSRRSVREDSTRATGEKVRGQAPAVQGRAVTNPRSGLSTRASSAHLTLVSINCEPARFAANHVPSQARRVGSHLVLVSGGHAASGTF